MIEAQDVIDLVRTALPDAVVQVVDRTGTKDHLIVHVVSGVFADMKPMDRHRTVQRALNAAMADGRIHALEIKTKTPE